MTTNRRAPLVTLATLGWLVVGLHLAGCDKPSSGGPAATTSAPVTASGAPLVSSAAAAPSSSAAPASSAAAGGGAYKGSYKAKVGAVTPPKDAKIKLWEKDPGTDFVGDGTIHIVISGAGESRSVQGEGKGALGDQIIRGVFDGKELSARVDPKDPNSAKAMTGVLSGKVEGGAIVGTLRVSGRNADIVREAELKLSPE